jgi:hypothetical protein
MNLNPNTLKILKDRSDVLPGNVYPAKGGRRTPGTEFWLVVATSDTGAHCIGFSADGLPVSTTSYLKGALRERPVIGRVDLQPISLISMEF